MAGRQRVPVGGGIVWLRIAPLAIALIAVLLAALVLRGTESARVDRCLDRGESYDYQIGQ